MSEERRWIVLGDDGRHVTLGRHSDPSEEEIEKVGHALKAIGQGGWLAVTEGVYYSRRATLGILMVREIASPRASWDDAAAAFHRLRRDAIAPQPEPDGPVGPG